MTYLAFVCPSQIVVVFYVVIIGVLVGTTLRRRSGGGGGGVGEEEEDTRHLLVYDEKAGHVQATPALPTSRLVEAGMMQV